MKKTALIPTFVALLATALSASPVPANGATNQAARIQYYDLRFDLASHEQTNSSRLITRRITTPAIIYSLALYAGVPTANLSGARLFQRTDWNENFAIVVRIGTNDYDVSQYIEISYPQNDSYHGILANRTGPPGVGRRDIQRIIQIVNLPNFDVQGFATITTITNHGRVSDSITARVAGGGSITSRSGIRRDGVLEGTFTLSGPVLAGWRPHPQPPLQPVPFAHPPPAQYQPLFRAPL